MRLLKILRSILASRAPALEERTRRLWQRWLARRFEKRHGLDLLARDFSSRHGLQVLEGPFAGMRYVPRSVGSVLVPKLLGSYESELHGALGELLQHPLEVVVDVGCAEGYYAVGCAMRLPNARVFAFDTEPGAQRLCIEMARRNGVASRVSVRGLCDHKELERLLSGKRSLVICDCEGCEYDLLRPDSVPALAQAHLLIELHPPRSEPRSAKAPDEGAAVEALLPRFEATHTADFVVSRVRNSLDYPALSIFTPEEQRRAISEWRPAGQRWLLLSPLASRSPLAT